MEGLELDYMESKTGDFIVKQREWSGSNNEGQGAPWSERKTMTMKNRCRMSMPLLINSTKIY